MKAGLQLAAVACAIYGMAVVSVGFLATDLNLSVRQRAILLGAASSPIVLAVILWFLSIIVV